MVEKWVAVDRSKREATKGLKALWQHVQAVAHAIPPAECLQQKQTNEGKFHLTSSAILWWNHETQQKLVSIFSNHFELKLVAESGVHAHAAIKLLWRSFANMYDLWREKDYLTATQVAQVARQFGECWIALGWKPTP